MARLNVPWAVMGVKSFLQSTYVESEAPGIKAIPNHPALREANTLTFGASDSSKRVRTPFAQKEAERHLEAYGGKTDAIDWVMNCIRLIVETASSAEWHVHDDKGNTLHVPTMHSEVPEEGEKPVPEMLGRLLREPNPYMTYEELIELTLIDYLLVGNAYWLKWRTNDAGQPLALYRLAPPYVKIVPGPFGVEGYVYDIPGRGKLELKPEQVMHFKTANPHSPYYGLGVIQGASRMLDLELALTDTAASYYEKKAQPSMVVQSDRRVPKDVFKRLQNQLRAMYGGPRNAGAMMVLEAGLKYQSISPSAAEAAFQAISDQSRDRILAMFRVPGSLLGISGVTTSGGSNQDQRTFDTKTMRPLLNKLQNAITRGVTSSWDCSFHIDYDYIMPVEERLRLASTFAALPGVKVKEVREYAGLDPLEDSEEEIAEMILNLPGEEGEEGNTRNGIPDNNLAGEGGRPPNPSSTRRFPANGQIPAGAAARRTSLAAGDNKSMTEIMEGLDRALERKAMQPDGGRTDMERRLTPPDDVLQDDRDAAVDSVTFDLTSEIKNAVHNLERGLLDELQRSYEGKAPGDRLRSKLRKSTAWTAFQSALSAAMEKAARSSISTAVMQQGRLGRVPDEEIDYDALAREVVFRAGGVRKITQNFKNEVSQKVVRALETGQTRADLEQAIREAADFWRESHAETVAMTEAVHAYNEGTITVAELTGHTHLYVHDGRDHDQPCVDADGQVWEIAHAREHRLEHPRCRRGFSPLTSQEVS